MRAHKRCAWFPFGSECWYWCHYENTNTVFTEWIWGIVFIGLILHPTSYWIKGAQNLFRVGLWFVKVNSLTQFSNHQQIKGFERTQRSGWIFMEKHDKLKPTTTHFMEGRCRSTTSTAWTGLVLMGLSSSRGSGMLRPVSTSWSMCQLTRDTNLMETLKGRSFPPSPGRVTSRSTWRGTTKIEAGFHGLVDSTSS